jgi:DNA-binding FrmR family transcriptional regulator
VQDDTDEGPLCSYCDERVSIPSIRKLIAGLSLLICDDCLRECFKNAVRQGWEPPKIDDKPV